MIKKIYNTVRTMIKLAQLLSVDDSGDMQLGTVKMFNTEQDTVLFTPYGLVNNPPKNSLVLSFSMQGQESNKIGIATKPDGRLKNLSAGEVAIVNQETGGKVHIKENGDIDIETSSGTINLIGNQVLVQSSSVRVESSNVTIDGALDMDGNQSNTITMGTSVVADTHIHVLDITNNRTLNPVNP